MPRSIINIIGRIKGVKSGDNRLLANFFSLSILQAFNYLLPLLTFPYLVRVLGIEKFGIVAFAQAMMAYFTVITDYGFNISATKDIAINRENETKISQIVSAVLAIKLALCVTSFGGLLVLLALVEKFGREYWLFAFSFSIVIGQASFPIWFFQGMERMKYITLLGVIAKVLTTALIFAVIREPDDYIYVNVFYGAGNALAGLIALLIMAGKFSVAIKPPGLAAIMYNVKAGWHVFIAGFTVTASIYSNLFILGIFAKPVELGYYSVAEKIYTVLRSLAAILYQTVYPKACLLAQESFPKLLTFFSKVVKMTLLLLVPLSVLTFIAADLIIYLIMGDPNPKAALLVRILCFGPLAAALNIPACQTMLAFRMNTQYALITTAGALLNVVLNLVFIHFLMGVGTALAALLTECIITLMLYAYLARYVPHRSVVQALNIFSPPAL